MGEVNSQSVTPQLGHGLLLKKAHRRTCSMFQILFLDQCFPMETEALAS